jgi:hypothetical protein
MFADKTGHASLSNRMNAFEIAFSRPSLAGSGQTGAPETNSLCTKSGRGWPERQLRIYCQAWRGCHWTTSSAIGFRWNCGFPGPAAPSSQPCPATRLSRPRSLLTRPSLAGSCQTGAPETNSVSTRVTGDGLKGSPGFTAKLGVGATGPRPVLSDFDGIAVFPGLLLLRRSHARPPLGRFRGTT